MSPRAASRLEGLGFDEVYDYVAGKQDWWAAGLPVEGESAAEPVISGLVRNDVQTSTPDDEVGHIRERLAGSGWDRCVVVSKEGVVVGELWPQHLVGARPEATAADVMQEGPRTFRPNVSVEEMKQWFGKRERIETVLVTGPDGRLLGLLSADDVLNARDELPATGTNKDV